MTCGGGLSIAKDRNPNISVKVAKLEVRMSSIEHSIEELKQQINKLSNRLWWVLGLIVSLLITILAK